MKKDIKQFSRRDLIKGLAATGILPSLSIEPLLAQESSAAPVRVLTICLQHGWGISATSNRFMSGSEFDFSFPDGLQALEAIKDQCVVVDGVLTLGLWGNNHDLSYADILTAGVPMNASTSDFDKHMPMSIHPSLDYLLEQQSGKPSFRFSAGYRSWGVSHHPMSFDDNGTVLPFYTKAVNAYDSIFKNLDQSGTQATAVNQRESQLVESLFDFIRKPAQRDLAAINADEQAKLERYLQAVDDVHVKKKPIVGYSGSQSVENIPVSGQSSLEDLPHFLEMIKVGFANNLTTSAVLGIGDIIKISEFHETHAHSNSDTWWNTRNEFAKHVANFVNDLSKIVDVDGNLLIDNTVILLTGEVGDGAHNIINKGQIVIGGGGGQITRGRYLKQDVITGRANIDALRREDINGVLQPQITYGNKNTQKIGTRTNADILRDIGNVAGLNIDTFGLPSQNKGTVIL